MHVLIINGHPRKGSFSEALVEAYAGGAITAGVNVTILNLADLSFNPNVITPSPNMQYHEEDILRSQQLIATADHLVFVYPTWWGTMPALLKGFLDRVFTPGFAFEEIEGGVTGYGKLLRGKSAAIISTMDTPLFINRWVNKSPGNNALKKATLQFCGIDPVQITNFSPLKKADDKKRQRWLEKVRLQAANLKNGRISKWKLLQMKTASWLQALRLQFYPMTLIAYAAGAFAAESAGYGFNRIIFWFGFLWLFLVEVSTVLSNDFFDFRSDKQNRFFSPFSGGSRVIIEKLLSFREMKGGIILSLVLSVFVLLLLFTVGEASTSQLLIHSLLLYTLAVGYTVPPFMLSYRGFGETDVALTHSFAVMLCGYILQGGSAGDSLPWLISVPLFLAVFPSIILAGIPDKEADAAVSKKTIAVRAGKNGAASMAMLFTFLSAATIIFFKETHLAGSVYNNLVYAIIPHACLLCWKLNQYIKMTHKPSRIDGLMVISLTYLIWFGMIPLINLMQGGV
jgi:putative NADPH-quinone reductase/1,4-dihydroxy-2-naphthoate octaprenyltransferase